MTRRALTRPERIPVKRSQFRQNQSALLRKARGSTIVVLTDRRAAEEKYILDKRYFDEVMSKLRAAIETLEIATDLKLFNQLLADTKTLDEDIRLGKLHSFEEAFAGD